MASSFLLVALICFTAITVLKHALWLTTDGRRRRLPPGPLPLPIIGNFHAVAWRRAHRSLADLAKNYGPLMCIWVGRFPAAVVSSPDAARKMLNNSDLAGRIVLDHWRAEGHSANSIIVQPMGDKWRAVRKFAATELLTKARLDARQQLREEKAQELVRYVSEHASRGEPVDVGHAAFTTAINLISTTLFSLHLGTHEFRSMVKEASRLAATPTISDVFPALAAADLQGARRRMCALIGHGYRIIDEQFRQRRLDRDAGEPRKNDMMDKVIDKEKQWKEEGSQLNYDAIKGLFTEFFIAGTETVSSTIEWAMAELLQHPESMKMAREELKTVIGTKRRVDESDISQLPYLRAVIKETLRLHSPVPLAFQRAMAPVQVDGYTIPKGTNLIINIWDINRHPGTWVEPDKFVPERFMDKDISFSGKDFELIPFSAGRRTCLGVPLADRMLNLILGSLLYHFDWTLPVDAKDNAIDMTEKYGAVVCMATPLKLFAKCDE